MGSEIVERFAPEIAEPLVRVRVCCGARCGAEPQHRAIYDAVEAAASRAGYATAPTMCRALCTGGVTVIVPDGTGRKVSAPATANSVLGDFLT